MKLTLLQLQENGRLTFGTGNFGGLETLGFRLILSKQRAVRDGGGPSPADTEKDRSSGGNQR